MSSARAVTWKVLKLSVDTILLAVIKLEDKIEMGREIGGITFS